MKKQKYVVTVKSSYIRDAQIFCPEDRMEQGSLGLDDADIFLSSECERYWKNMELSAYSCLMACTEIEEEKRMKEIAGKYGIPASFLELIPVG